MEASDKGAPSSAHVQNTQNVKDANIEQKMKKGIAESAENSAFQVIQEKIEVEVEFENPVVQVNVCEDAQACNLEVIAQENVQGTAAKTVEDEEEPAGVSSLKRPIPLNTQAIKDENSSPKQPKVDLSTCQPSGQPSLCLPVFVAPANVVIDERKQSEPNESLIRGILQESRSGWTASSQAPYELVPIGDDSLEYKNINELFHKTVRSYELTKLERVDNPFLFAQYMLKKTKMIFADERLLFHGTRRQNIDGICRHNFNWRLNGLSRGNKFGKGVSFSHEAFYSTHYTPDGILFLVKVLVSKSHVGDRGTTLPRETFDTTENMLGTVVVKYEDDDFYPCYILHFKKG